MATDKLAIISISLLLIWSMSRTIFTGRRVQAQRSGLVLRHRTYGYCTFVLTLVQIGLVEASVRTAGGASVDALLFCHLAFALPYLLTLLLLLRFTGNRSPRHGRLAYTCVVLFVGTIITGVPNVMRL